MDHHQYNNMIRPPPTDDPRHPPPPPPGQWFPPPPPQYSYHHPPPPPPQPYPAHNQPYHAHTTHNTQYSYRPNLPPPPPQDWGNTNWGHHLGWEHPARQDEEDWAAKARAWAENKSVNDNQHLQSQFTPVSRLEGQSTYHDPYQQNVESHYADVQSSNPSPGYHQYPAPGSSSFVSDEHVAYGAKDGRFGGDSNAVYHHQESSSVSSLVHMKEVPSSYSSITGNVENGDGNEKSYKSYPYPTDPSQVPFHDHLPPPPVGRPVLMEQPHYGVHNHAAELPSDLSDQPLSFARRSNFDHEQMMQQNYNTNDPARPVRGVDHVAPAPSHYSLASAHMSGTVYPPFPPGPPSAQQHGPSANLTSSFPGHSTPSFAMMSGPSFQSSIPAMGIGATSGLHPTTVFPGDIYGVLSGSDRPKKAPVPDWLKEEIIKNKAIIASSGPERPTDSIEDEIFDKTPGRGDQEDSQSIGSPRSAVEEDEEDNMEAVRTAEVNQEIKKILTEVLLKVTDELFDEIATQVLEEDLTTQVAQETVAAARKPSFAMPAVPTSKTSAKVIIAAKEREVDTEDESGKNASNSPGDLLGLASYASDDDDDDGDANNSVQHQPSTKKLPEDDYTAENGTVETKFGSDNKSQVHENNYKRELVSNGARIHHEATVSGLAEDDHNFEVIKTVETPSTSKTNNSVGEKVNKTEQRQDVSVKPSAADDSRDGEPRNKQVNKDDDVGETKSSYVGRDIVKAGDASKDRKGGKKDESLRRHDERYGKSERTSDKNSVSKEKTKEQGGKSVDKVKESDPKKRSSDPDSRKEKERDRRGNDKDDSDRRRERKKDDKEDRSRDKHRSESNRHKRRRSPSVGSRGRSGKANFSSDGSSDDSKRKLHTKKRNLSRSPSPNRSRKRQDSRSPPSKRSHRRHSPFSSLETTRGRRSRSRSPARRQR